MNRALYYTLWIGGVILLIAIIITTYFIIKHIEDTTNKVWTKYDNVYCSSPWGSTGPAHIANISNPPGPTQLPPKEWTSHCEKVALKPYPPPGSDVVTCVNVRNDGGYCGFEVGCAPNPLNNGCGPNTDWSNYQYGDQ